MDAGAPAIVIASPAAGHRAIHHRDRAVEVDAGRVLPVAAVGLVVLEEAVVDDAAGGVKPHAAALVIGEGAPVGGAAGDEAALDAPARHPDIAAVAVALLSAGAAVLDGAIGDKPVRHPDVSAFAVAWRGRPSKPKAGDGEVGDDHVRMGDRERAGTDDVVHDLRVRGIVGLAADLDGGREEEAGVVGARPLQHHDVHAVDDRLVFRDVVGERPHRRGKCIRRRRPRLVGEGRRRAVGVHVHYLRRDGDARRHRVPVGPGRAAVRRSLDLHGKVAGRRIAVAVRRLARFLGHAVTVVPAEDHVARRSDRESVERDRLALKRAIFRQAAAADELRLRVFPAADVDGLTGDAGVAVQVERRAVGWTVVGIGRAAFDQRRRKPLVPVKARVLFAAEVGGEFGILSSGECPELDQVVVLQYRPRRAGRVGEGRGAVEVASVVRRAEVCSGGMVDVGLRHDVVAVGDAVHDLSIGVVDMDARALAVVISRQSTSHHAVDHRDRAVEIDTRRVLPVAVVCLIVLEEAAVDNAARGVKPHAAALAVGESAPLGPAAGDEAALNPPAGHVDVAAVAIALLGTGVAVRDDAVGDEPRRHLDVAALSAIGANAFAGNGEVRDDNVGMRDRERPAADDIVHDLRIRRIDGLAADRDRGRKEHAGVVGSRPAQDHDFHAADDRLVRRDVVGEHPHRRAERRRRRRPRLVGEGRRRAVGVHVHHLRRDGDARRHRVPVAPGCPAVGRSLDPRSVVAGRRIAVGMTGVWRFHGHAVAVVPAVEDFARRAGGGGVEREGSVFKRAVAVQVCATGQLRLVVLPAAEVD